ncbi:MAG: preprotein translocase subunit SecA [Oscillospiraceae bacterium]|nr:preprotein translocase subunit SecA [Oscillospiraceae bacterium]
MSIITKLFGSRSSREVKKIMPLVEKIEAMEESYQRLSDEELKAKTPEFKNRLAAGETLDDILPEAFATVREAAGRVLGMRHYPVQLIGGVVLHQGRIAEMKTGEGKTLVATLPAYLNALNGQGVHIVTVNDYLAKRDSEWMGKVHRFLGLSVGLIVHGLSSEERRAAYAADITYGTNNELGFDYLRDNMAVYKKELVQRGHVFAIVDEVDSILIDEARTPLIISGKGDDSTDLYQQADLFVRRLKKKVYASTDEKQEEDENVDADYIVDEKANTATLTARGIAKAEQHFGIENLGDLENSTLSHHINQALKAHGVMKRDVDYVIKDGEIIIVDEFTGRLMFGRRYNEGLHQATEAKEGVQVQSENKTLATITFQNFFRMYQKLSGMTGTALTEEEEFNTIYNLDVVEIPTNKPVIRLDRPDVIYKNGEGKDAAILQQIAACHEKGQPVLVGTISIEKSEHLSRLLSQKKIPHNVLNAKQHEREAEIVAQAGKFGAVTIATNMAGRGTDIMLGGNPEYMAKNDLRKAEYTEEEINEATGYGDTSDERILSARELFQSAMAAHKAETSTEAEKVKAAGGLFILGTERHESRRIDNQLRGRSGRQGDPGETRFYIAMTDDLMRLFGGERVQAIMEGMGMEDDMPIDNKLISNALENAQKRVESRNFQSRKTVLEYDDVMNQQRELIYKQRKQVLDGEDVSQSIRNMVADTIEMNMSDAMKEKGFVSDLNELQTIIAPYKSLFVKEEDFQPTVVELNSYTKEYLLDRLKQLAFEYLDAKEKRFGFLPGTETPVMRELERVILLRAVDENWMEHIDAMDDLRRGIGLRGYGNTKPIDAYKQEGFEMFDAMINGIKSEVTRKILTVEIKRPEESVQRHRVAKESLNNLGGEQEKAQPVRKTKIGRNELCPCGSGKKYKYCHGRDR